MFKDLEKGKQPRRLFPLFFSLCCFAFLLILLFSLFLHFLLFCFSCLYCLYMLLLSLFRLSFCLRFVPVCVSIQENSCVSQRMTVT